MNNNNNRTNALEWTATEATGGLKYFTGQIFTRDSETD